MAKSELGGVWRTINGNRVFIKEGQSVAEAIEEDKKKKGKTETKETENKPKEIENKSDDDKRFAELKEKFDKGEIEKYSDEDYELRDRNLDKKVKEGILTKEEAEEQKLRNDFQTDRISRDEYEKRKGNFGEEMASDTPEKREERKKWREEQERPTSDVDKETAKANRQTEKIEKGKEDFDPVEFEKWRVENDPEFEMSDDTARYIYEIDKETGSRSGSNNEFTSEELKEKYGTDDVELINAGKEAQDRVTKKEELWEKQEDGSFKANKDAMKADYEARHKKYDEKIKQFAEDRENMTNSDWEASIMAYEKQNADGTYKTMDQIMEDVEEYGKAKRTYMDIPQEERVKAFEEGKNWKDLVKEYNTRDSRGGLPGDDSLVEKGRKAGVSDEEIADAIYERHGGAESNDTSDDNIKRLLAKKAKEDAQANGYEDRAKMFENYEKEFNNRINQKKSTNEIMNDKIRNSNNKKTTNKEPTLKEKYEYLDKKGINALNNFTKDDDDTFVRKEYDRQKALEMSEDTSQKSISENLQFAAYNKYLKEHPGSKITFEDFKKKNK